jgi:two-component system OmpR family sensor kinase
VRSRLASLSSRLVLTAVALVVVVSAVIGAFATLALQERLTSQVDTQVQRTVRAATFLDADGARGGTPDTTQPGEPPPGRPGGDPGNISPDTVVARFPDSGEASGERFGFGRDNQRTLSAAVLAELDAVPVDGEVHGVDLTALGGYRVQAVEVDGGTVVVGVPSRDVDAAVSSLLGWEVALVVLGGLVAAGAARLLVRRQLRPLTEVADTAHAVSALPLSQGEIRLTERVPAHLTDEDTEVGQVGAALNRLLAHVETSLDARQRSEQQVRQFVADASHELRTPLATIVGYTELARRRPDDATRTTALAKVEEESARMTGLVEDLLLLARLDAAQPLARERVDLTRVLLEAVADVQVLDAGRTWRLELPEEAVEVVGDAQRLHQVVTNLLTNARKHTPPGTTVTVVATTGPDATGFEVRDDGPGFPPALAPVAFERFARGDAARERTGGAGLGLALVRAIVTSLGGSVSLTSEPGDTRVRVDLPAVG